MQQSAKYGYNQGAMNVLSIENLEKTVNDAPLFSEVTLGLEKGEKCGIVGRNGTGKTTFLRILSGEVQPDEGRISYARDAEMITLDQSITFAPKATVSSFFFQTRSRKLALLEEYQQALANGDEKRYTALLPLLEKSGVWELEVNYQRLLEELEFKHESSALMEELSGGEQKKVAIARALALEPDILLLDEPTNHLDIRTIEYLENYLRDASFSLIIVTHDRYILNSVCETIWELDRGRFYRHSGSYEAYLERRAQRIEIEQKEQERIASILRRELVWLQRGPQARTGKDKNRKQRIQQMLSSQHNVQDIKQKSFSSAEKRLGKKILEIDSIGFSYKDRTLFEGFSYLFKAGDRIGVAGDNGCGKSTLLDILTGTKEPTEGKVDIGVNTSFGYYDQLGRDLKSDKTALEYIEEIGTTILTGEGPVSSARFLELFGFPPSRQRTAISVFSGGEKRRLYLLSKLALNPNFLVLDEPTNDLDIPTMENLEEYISSFPGCTLIVSHDRSFLDCTCDYLFIIEGGRITLFTGHYSEWKTKGGEKDEREKRSDTRPQREKRGLSFKEQKELETLEAEIDELEKLIRRLEESFATAAETEDGTLKERTEKYQICKAALDRKSERWLCLAEKG